MNGKLEEAEKAMQLNRNIGCIEIFDFLAFVCALSR